MVQWLRALAVLTEGTGLGPKTLSCDSQPPITPVPGDDQMPSLAPVVPICMWHT